LPHSSRPESAAGPGLLRRGAAPCASRPAGARQL